MRDGSVQGYSYGGVVNSCWTSISRPKVSHNLNRERTMLICKWFTQWTSSEKVALFQNLLKITTPSERKEIYQIFKSTVPETAIDFTRILPRIVSLYIFSFLDPRSLCRAAQVSCYWKILCESNAVWAPKCLSLGWQLPNVLAQPESGAYKQLYIENLLNLRLDGSNRVKSELKKMRRRLALDEQRVAESQEKQFKGQKHARERRQVHLSPQQCQPSENPRVARNGHEFSLLSKSLERASAEQTSNRAKITAAAERLSVPLRRQRNRVTYQSPILNIFGNSERAYQQKSTKPPEDTPPKKGGVPFNQGFVPLSPKAMKSLPPPPPYEPRKIKEMPKETRKKERENEIFELIRDVPT